MSYHYHITPCMTISGERLTTLAYQYGKKKITWDNLNDIINKFAENKNGNPYITIDEKMDNGTYELFLTIVHGGWSSESDGIQGIIDLITSYDGIVDPVTVTITDDYGKTADVVLN